jgi:hypothetical protein
VERPVTRLLAALAALLGGACSGPHYAEPRVDPPIAGGAPTSPPPSSGSATECTGEGEDVPSGGRCCEGLAPAPVYKGSIIRLDECELEGRGRSTCIRCGDGRCGKGENTCNCPRDCH